MKDYGLPEFVNRLTPVVEVAWSSPASRPNQDDDAVPVRRRRQLHRRKTTRSGVEALIPGNKQTGSQLGVIAQFHLYFDDLFPNSLGKPIVSWFQ